MSSSQRVPRLLVQTAVQLAKKTTVRGLECTRVHKPKRHPYSLVLPPQQGEYGEDDM